MHWAFGEGWVLACGGSGRAFLLVRYASDLWRGVLERGFGEGFLERGFGEGFWRGVLGEGFLERGSWRGVLGEGFLERVLGKLFSFTWDGVGRARIRDDEFWQELEFLICCFASREWEFEIDIRRR